MITDFFDENGIMYEEIPQSYHINLWARKLKTADFAVLALWTNIVNVTFGFPMLVILYYFTIKLFNTLHSSTKDDLHLELLAILIICGFLALILTTLNLYKNKVKERYKNRHYFRVSKECAECIDGLPLVFKYGAKLKKVADNVNYVLIVLEGASAEESTFLLFPQSALSEKPKNAVYFSKKRNWFDKPKNHMKKLLSRKKK